MPEGPCEACGGTEWVQDEDTLDTWFSSALWPFSTLGWPDDTPEFRHFYPTSVLVTGYDIIFFWVVRMVFSGLEHTGECPFQDVFIDDLQRVDSIAKAFAHLSPLRIPHNTVDKYILERTLACVLQSRKDHADLSLIHIYRDT